MAESRKSKWRKRASWLGLLISFPNGVVCGIAGVASEGNVAVGYLLTSALSFVATFLCVAGILRSMGRSDA